MSVSSETSQPIIRPLERSEVDTLFSWVRQEGWNPGIHDAETIYRFCPEGLLGVFSNKQLVGVSAVFNYSPAYANFGLYIVKPEYRGYGYGLWMTRHRLNIAGQRSISLDGVMENLSKYRRVGFRMTHVSCRFEFAPGTVTDFTPPAAMTTDINSIPLSTVVSYETNLFPTPRQRFLDAWLTQPEAVTAAWVEDGKLQGYGLMRPCIKGFKIGPLFADTPAIAEQMIRYFLSESQGQSVLLDVPEPNADALKLCEQFKTHEVSRTARMYRGYEPDLNLGRIYGLTSLETG